ncbi:MAG: tetratricopeptide repeat-containing sensor histidine kinase [Chitinophagaceae bacterium]|nr:tetratricopeptide repeat-containing sensor histidine kinase [Chitinophagaceae bacterium]
MKRYLLLLFISISSASFGQADTNYLKLLYDRCLEFDESKADSICHYADYIQQQAEKLEFYKGPVLSLRLKGLCKDLKAEYKTAIDFYYQSLEEARRINEAPYEISALSDLAIAYFEIGRPAESKKFYVECAELALESKEVYTVVSSYNNLGVIYNQLGQYDSALIFLNKALQLETEGSFRLDPSGTYNNIGNAWFKKKDFQKALYYFSMNHTKHLVDGEPVQLWTDHINLADVYLELKRFDSALFHANKAMAFVDVIKSKSKEADTYSLLARVYERRGKYETAYSYLTKWYALDTAMVNGNTQSTIAELQERFNAKERDAENKLLLGRVETERVRNSSMRLLASALAIIVILAAAAFVIKRNANRRLTATNELIQKQNQRLADLNQEKNSLISIVSHDLGTPFATIKMWSNLLDSETLNTEQSKAIQRIQQAGEHGQQLIQRILDVERQDIGSYKLDLQNINLQSLIETAIDDFKPAADKKRIHISRSFPSHQIIILSDRHLLLRILENLLSNALKYSRESGRVWISVQDENQIIRLILKDEGVGINADELPALFSKYGSLSSRPTAGEHSTGLGLSIVKRIVEELNGKIFCTSIEGEGSIFTIELPK